MYEQVKKPKENKSRAVANSVAQKKSIGKQGFGFVDNRPVSIEQRKTQAQLEKPIQRARLRDSTFKTPSVKDGKKIRRALAKAGKKKGWKPRSKRNLMVVRFISEDGSRRYNLVLRSAGMGTAGQKHPIGVNNRTASHTEPQLVALLRNTTFKEKVEKRVGKKFRVKSIFSSNLPCSSAGGGSPQGCGAIDGADMGNPEELTSNSTAAYTGGSGPTYGQAVSGDEDACSTGSQDSVLADDDVRGKNLETYNFS